MNQHPFHKLSGRFGSKRLESTKTQQVSGHLEPWHRLDGKVVMVTGASSGLGSDFCLDLARAGCNIIAAARREDRLKSLCDQINGGDVGRVRAVAVKLDLCGDGPTIEKAVENAWKSFGWIDALINNAGVGGSVKSVVDVSEEEWNHVVGTNLTGSWLVSKCICKWMRERNAGGSIINISSAAAVNRGLFFGSVAYASSKAAMDTLTKMMVMEMGAHQIRVNSIAPGLFKSEITEGLMQNVALIDKLAKKMVPLRAIGATDPALTMLIRYLIHDSSQYVSGNVFIADAGATLPGVPIFSSL